MWTYQGKNSRQEQAPILNTLTACVNKAVLDGYNECFKVTVRGLYAISKGRYYRPEQVQVVITNRFEGYSGPGSSAVMYLIETSEGIKGTLVDTSDTSGDLIVNKFIAEAEDIHKKIAKYNQHEC